MRFLRVLAIASLLVGFGVLQLAAAEVAKPAAAKMTAPAKRGPVTIVKAKLDPAVVIAAGTGVQGTIKLDGALTPQLSAMKCSDIMVVIGKYITPPPPTSTTTLNIPTFEEVASNMATGDIASGACTYKVIGVPTSTQYTVLMNAHPQGVHCDLVYLDEKPYQPKLTFKPGQMQTQNFVVKPVCTIVK
jgi:hypothetical protein